jgi:hypothetical protein
VRNNTYADRQAAKEKTIERKRRRQEKYGQPEGTDAR